MALIFSSQFISNLETNLYNAILVLKTSYFNFRHIFIVLLKLIFILDAYKCPICLGVPIYKGKIAMAATNVFAKISKTELETVSMLILFFSEKLKNKVDRTSRKKRIELSRIQIESTLQNRVDGVEHLIYVLQLITYSPVPLHQRISIKFIFIVEQSRYFS